MSTNRPKHPDPDLEKLINRAEGKQWRVSKGKKYFICKCPCGTHLETVHLTPSSRRYLINKTKCFERATCWKGETS